MAVRRHRRYSVEFKLQLVHAYLAGEGSLKRIAGQYGINHSLLLVWIEKHRRGELGDEQQLADQVRESEAQIAALERKIGQLTMELDAVNRGLTLIPPKPSGASSIISGPEAFPCVEGASS